MPQSIYEIERENLLKPYDQNDLLTHRTGRRFRTVLGHIHSENWDLIDHAVRLNDILEGKRDGLFANIAERFIPSDKPGRNCACTYLKSLRDLVITYGEGKCPKTRVIIYASRSTVTLIDSLMTLHSTPELINAKTLAEKLFTFIAYEGEPTMSPKAYEKVISETIQEFIDLCIANAEKLSLFLGEQAEKRREERRVREAGTAPATAKEIAVISDKQTDKVVAAVNKTTKATETAAKQVAESVDKGAKKIARAVKKPRGRKPKFSIVTQEAAYTIHLRESKNAEVKKMGVTGAKIENEFTHAKRELIALGIKDEKSYKAALRARTKRISNSAVCNLHKHKPPKNR